MGDGHPRMNDGENLLPRTQGRAFTNQVTLDQDLAELPQPLVDRLSARGFSSERLLDWAASVGRDRDARNRLPGTVEPPLAEDVVDLPPPGSPEHLRNEALGRDAIARGEVALCVLAGGMATRMGGVVKALVQALPGKTFLDMRLLEMTAVQNKFGARPPLWLMTSEATNDPIREVLAAKNPAGKWRRSSNSFRFVSRKKARCSGTNSANQACMRRVMETCRMRCVRVGYSIGSCPKEARRFGLPTSTI
jgi:hypothetical protein